ncbi:hypothetical protein MAR_004969 [Mya arenaria]|uniref:Uncharacterized protein n=1 Tax=Mya arenaria TaxID=6604 RepID=A0ABY7F0I9_MYAAR|nr:hypothetical protein MAR_004969 [Mya arenaria]
MIDHLFRLVNNFPPRVVFVHLRALFRDMGRSGEWNPVLQTGNPASALILKKHLKAIGLEQTACNVAKKQAVPLMFDKLGALCRYLTYQIAVERDAHAKFLLLRDRAYFSLICHSGDRAGDLGQLTLDRVFELPDNQGIFISEISGKTVSLHNPKNIVVFRSKDDSICPVTHLQKYMSHAATISVDITRGYLFRLKDKFSKDISEKQVTATAMSDRLKCHLKAINLYNGESAHSSRRGCAIVLRMLGLADTSINQHIGWGSGGMLDHYARVGTLCSPNSVAATLSDAAALQPDGVSRLEVISKQFSRLEHLSKFSCDNT